MWTRKELKDKSKVSFKANYWKSVFVALIVLVLAGGMGGFSAIRSVPAATPASSVSSSSYSPDDVNVEIKDGKIKVDVNDEDGRKVHVDMDSDDFEELEDVLDGIDVDDEGIASTIAFWPGMILVGISVFLASLVVVAIAIALYVFIMSPLEVGAARFFVRNLNQRAEVKEVAFGYDNNYKEIVKTLFLRSLFIFLWGLLLIIPGIYKAYEYRMIPYLLAEDPTMAKDRAFAESKSMMDGQKWNAFVLDLSFIGWNILSALTLGVLGVFYVAPYQTQTNAALYEKLRYGLPAPEPVAQAAPTAPAYETGTPIETTPVIVPDSQPPVPPFAQIGALPAHTNDQTQPTLPMPGDAENNDTTDSPDA